MENVVQLSKNYFSFTFLRSKSGEIQTSVDEFNKRVIRDTIEEFYTQKKTVPSIAKLLPVLKNKIDWKWSATSLRNVLKSMGFKWKKVQNKRQLLIERPDIVFWRSRFVVQLKNAREAGTEIFYLDETWVDNNLTFGKCWQTEGVTGVTAWGSASRRLIIGSVGSKKGFLKEAQLQFWAKSSQGDYHGQMNCANFEKWFQEKVLVNLPPHSVIVLDNAPYHCRQLNKPPTKYDTKAIMVEWLQIKEVECDESMRKEDLYELIVQNKPSQKSYVIDHLAASKGHKVVRLPPYNCDLNAIEFAWAKLKQLFRERNITGDMSAAHLVNLAEASYQSITTEDWQGYCRKVQELEEDYWRRDGVMQIAIDNFVINAGPGSTTESDNSSTDTATDDGSGSDW